MSVRKRTLPSGEIRWQIDYRDRDGTRRAKQFEKKGEAVAWETNMRDEMRRGTHVADGASITVKEAGEFWIVGCETNGLERATIEAYRNHLNKHIVPLIGKTTLNKLTVAVARQFLYDLGKTSNRPTVRKVLRSLKQLVDDAVSRGTATHNPIAKVKAAASSARHDAPIEFPTLAEIKALLAADGHLRTFVHVAIFGGMRASEIRGLQWTNVDFRASEIHVRQRADKFGKIGPCKSKAGFRDLRIGASLSALLAEWKLAQPVEQRGRDLVFPNAEGDPQSHKPLWTAFREFQVACGVTEPQCDDEGRPKHDKVGRPMIRAKYGLHALRHACASLLIDQGWLPKRIQGFMGHASIKLTFDTYGHLFKDAESDAKAIAMLEARLLS